MATKTAPKRAPGYRCTECGWTTVKWVGRCGECQAWGTVEEVGLTSTTGRTRAATVDACVRPAVAAPPASSTVPHAWHSPQRPTHFTVVQPHSVQR